MMSPQEATALATTTSSVQSAAAPGTGVRITRANSADHRDVLGPRVVIMTPLTPENESYCLVHAIFPAGVFVPVHSHEDRETFYVLSGQLEAWDGHQWHPVGAGDALDVPGHLTHAWRNRSGEDATVIFVTTGKMGRFFDALMQEAAAFPPGPPTPEALARLGELSARYGYWLGSADDNAAAGLG